MDRFEAMRVYVQIVERGGFAAAAEALQLHRPAVTLAVQQLERNLGVRLLNRSTRKVSVTAEGDEFYRQCLDLLANVSDIFNRYAQQRTHPGGRLRVDLPVTLAKSIIVPALPEFRQRYPKIDLIVGASDQPADLVTEGIDCVLRVGELRDSSLVARKIGAVPMVTCGSPGYFARHGVPRTLKDLQNHLAVNFISGRSRRMLDWSFLSGDKETRVRLKSAIVAVDSETLLSCALAGLGIIHGVRPALEPYLQSGALREILPRTPSASKPVYVMYPSKTNLPAKTRVFVDWLSELISRRCPS